MTHTAASDHARDPGPELRASYLALTRRRRLYSGLFLLLFVALFASGFRIAEEDLRLRGEGEMLGSRQSGLPGFRLARLETDGDLLTVARDEARLIMERDRELEGTRSDALRALLYLFERDAGVRLLRAG